MTNGEKIKEIFPNIIKYGNILIDDTGALQKNILFDDTWWNAEYKEPTTQERQAESDIFDAAFQDGYNNGYAQARFDYEQETTTKNKLGVREFEEIEVTYPPEEVCTYPEYKGKPYFGIKYKENGEEIVGYGTYKLEVLSQYLRDYFISTTKNDLVVDCISRKQAVETIQKYGVGCFDADEFSPEECERFVISELNKLPSVTPQLSSGLDKNSKKLEKDFGELDCISRTSALDSINWAYNLSDAYQKINDLPSITSQEPKIVPIAEIKFDEDKLKELVNKAVLTVTPQEPRVDFEELKRRIFMEVDGGTDDAWLAYGEVCDRISNAINEFVSDMRGEKE